MTLNIRLLSLALLSVLAVALGACGGDDGDGGPAADEKRKGGTLTELAAGDVDYLDPGRTYYQFGLQVQYAISRPLYSFVPGKVEEPVPDLAAEMPEISEDKKTVTVRLRRGVRFGPPVSREVVAGDVKYAFERVFSPPRATSRRWSARPPSRRVGSSRSAGSRPRTTTRSSSASRSRWASRSPPRW